MGQLLMELLLLLGMALLGHGNLQVLGVVALAEASWALALFVHSNL